MELRDKVVLITGASRGIGRAIALAFARQQAHLVLAGRDHPRLEQVAEEARRHGVETEVVVADMQEEAQIKAMIQAGVRRFSRLEVLVNNAGLGYFRPVAELTTAQWDEMFAVNLRGVFLATREALPFLRRAGESLVINVASLAGKNTFVNGGGYTATKWGLRAFAQCLMLEERRNGVRVLTICPGSVATDFGHERSTASGSSRPGIVQPEDVAACILTAVQMPQRAMVSEIDIRPTLPPS